LHPLAAAYYVTTRCNLNCTYCEDFGAQRNMGAGSSLSLQAACRVLGAIRKGVDSLILTGGEPLLYPEIVPLAAHARQDLRFRRLTLLSNGLLLPQHEALLPLLDRLVISLDSVDPQLWDGIISMPPGTAETILDNLVTYGRRQREFRLRIVVNCVLSPKTLPGARDLLDFCRKHNLLVSFSPQAVNNWPRYELLVSEEYRQFIAELIAQKRHGAPILGSMAYLRTILEFRPYSCYPTLIPRIMPNGELLYPCRPIEREESSHGGRFDELLKTESWTQALKRASDRYGPPPRVCTSCFQQCFADPSLMQARPLSLGQAWQAMRQVKALSENSKPLRACCSRTKFGSCISSTSKEENMGNPLEHHTDGLADSHHQQVVVVGAGIAGLSAALHLAERGLAPLVLEADELYCGGRVAGGDEVELDGWRFRSDHGVHAVWSPYRNLQAMLARHSIRPVFVPAQEEDWLYKRSDQVKRAPVGRAIRHSWVPAPFHYLNLFFHPRFLGMLSFDDLLGLLPVWGGLLWGLGIDPFGEGQPLADLWLSDLIQGWSPALSDLFVGLTRNGLSAQPAEIPLSGFIAFLRFYTLRRRDSWFFSYLPADGGTSLAEPLLGTARELGADVKLGVRVTALEREPEGWRLQWQAQENNGSLFAQRIILATSAPATAAILDASPNLAEAASNLYWPRGMATAVVRLWFDRAPSSGAEAGILGGGFLPDNFFWLHRIQDPYIRWHRATGGSALEAHIYGPPTILQEPDALLLTRTIADVQSAFPELRGHQIHQDLRRNDPTHTLPSVGPAGLHLGIETPWPGLHCGGDWVRPPSPAFFMERACVTGIEAANVVLNDYNHPPWPLLEYAEPEPLVAWMEKLMLRGRRAMRRKR